METKDFVLGFAAGKAQSGGGGDEPSGTIQITANGNHNVKKYATAAVNVPNSYTASDEGKVVDAGALVAQTAHSEITENGTYDTTLNDEVVVNVPSSGSIITGSNIPIVSQGSNGDLYLRQREVPTGLTFVEYLESSGVQYIDTDIVPGMETDMFIKVKWLANSYVAGVRTGPSNGMNNALYCGTNNYGIGIIKTGNNDVAFDTARVDDQTNAVELLATGLKTGNGFRSLNYTGKNIRFISSYSNTTMNANGSIILFGGRLDGTIAKGIARIFRVILYENKAVLRDYIPCLDSNNIPCMYEAVSGELAYNEGTGDFTYGQEITTPTIDNTLYIKEDGVWIALANGVYVNT